MYTRSYSTPLDLSGKMVALLVVVEVVVIQTPDAYNFTYIDDYGVYAVPGDNLLFRVRAKSDVHVALTRYDSQFL